MVRVNRLVYKAKKKKKIHAYIVIVHSEANSCINGKYLTKLHSDELCPVRYIIVHILQKKPVRPQYIYLYINVN